MQQIFFDAMAEDALARAREIAARLSGGLAGSSDLGKRKNRWDDDPAGGPGLGSIQRKKIYFPTGRSDINFLGLIIGPKGSQQKQMSEQTGAKILIRGKGASKDGGPSNTGHSDDNDELHVSIEGPPEAVEKATREVDRIFNDTEYAMKLKQQQLGHTHSLGSGGGGGDTIYGPGGNEGYQVELRVPNNMVGLIIGKQGENIIRIQNQLGVHAQVAKEHEMQPGETLRSIVLKGSPSNVQEAKQRIDEIINQQIAKLSGGSNGSGGGGGNSNDRVREMDYPFIVKLPVPNDKVGYIIGKGGMNIKGIQERTRSNVQIPLGPDEENPSVRTLAIGANTKEDIDAAQMEIFMTLQQEAAGRGSTAGAVFLLVPDDRVGIIIGKQGATIKDIQNRLRVRVQIPQQPDPGSMPPMRTVSITGPADMQAIAKYEIEMIVAGTPLYPHQGGGGRDRDRNSSAAADPYASMYGGGAWGQSAYGGGYYGAAAANPYGAQAAYGMPAAAQSAYGYYGAAAAPGAAAGAAYGAYGAAAAPTADASAAAAASTAAAGAEAVPTDPTAYYNDFWAYATYYGEAAARTFYGAWSPPEGTPPPPGIVVATPEAAAANLAAAQGGAAPAPAAADATAAADSANAPATDATPSAAAGAETATAAEATSTGASATAAGTEEAPLDPEAAAAAWEAYKKQYSEWYEAYGKSIGADPNPPEQ